MHANGILRSALSRRETRRVRRSFEDASMASATLSTHAMRKIKRISWEADRSPSRLGRTAERAEQMAGVITPATAMVTALCAAGAAALELHAKFKARER